MFMLLRFYGTGVFFSQGMEYYQINAQKNIQGSTASGGGSINVFAVNSNETKVSQYKVNSENKVVPSSNGTANAGLIGSGVYISSW